MIRIENLNKIYKTKRGYITEALKDINIDFPDKGMFFIVGKSGCGKSTLLNIIGGIEKPSNGSIFYSNNNLNFLKPFEMDFYRGNLIGFIFQDYNLIGHLSVKENLKIANDINGKTISEQRIDDALKKVGLQDFANHLPEEMSGGQQQRVAISRAILKDPKIILADEPTGNLDSATGKDIFDLLKEISLNKLVIVVSHDKESARQYGDGIMELKDGKVILNNIDSFTQSNSLIFEKKRTNLKFNSLARFSLYNFKKKPIMLIIAVLLCITAITLGIYSQALADFKFYNNLSETLEQNNIDIFSVNKSYGNYAEFSDECFTTNEYNAIKEKYTDNNIYKITNDNEYLIINGKSDIENMGLDLIENSRDIDDTSIYVSDLYVREKLNYASYYHYQDNVFSNIVSIENFIGDIYGSKDIDDWLFNVSGIVNTGYAEIESFTDTATTKEESINKFFNSNFNIKFCTENYLRNKTNNTEYKSIVNIDNTSVIYENTTITQDYDFYGLDEDISLNASSILIYEDGSMWMNSIYDSNIILKTYECVIPLTLYNNLFGTTYNSNDFVDIMDYNNIPKEMPLLGQTINITIMGEDKSVKLIDMKVVGVVFYPQLTGEDVEISDIYVSKSHITKLVSNFNLKIYSIIGVISNYNEFSDFISNTQNIIIDSAYSTALYKYEESIEYYKNTYLVISIVLVIIAIFLLYSHINNGIITEKKCIGILRSLGASQNNIINIYLFQGVLISALISIIVTVFILSMVNIANLWMAEKIISGAILISISPLMIVESIFTSFIAMLFAVLMPTIKLSRMKPIDVIRKI